MAGLYLPMLVSSWGLLPVGLDCVAHDREMLDGLCLMKRWSLPLHRSLAPGLAPDIALFQNLRGRYPHFAVHKSSPNSEQS